MSLAPLHDVNLALAEPDLNPIDRLVLILAQTNPGTHVVADRAQKWLISEAAFLSGVRKLVRKGFLQQAQYEAGEITLQPVL